MQRMKLQSILSFLVLGAMASSAFAQTGGLGAQALPPLPLGAASAPVAQSPVPALPPVSNDGLPVNPAAVVVPTPPSPATTTRSSIASAIEAMAQKGLQPEAEAPSPKVYPYGGSNLSVLFLPSQIESMKQAIRSYEDKVKDSKAEAVAPEAAVPVEQAVVIPEPPSYPVFFLASIAFDSPSDWSLWVSGAKITPRKNDTDLSIVRVTPDSVTFSWMPTYNQAIKNRRTQSLFASTEPVKNKLASAQTVDMDAITGKVTFTLRQNQSFVVGYFSAFEGFVEAPKLTPITLPTSNPDGSVSVPDGSAPENNPNNPGDPNNPGMQQPNIPGGPGNPGMQQPNIPGQGNPNIPGAP